MENVKSVPELAIQDMLERAKKVGVNLGGMSDGYHSFDELYEMRGYLFSLVCKKLSRTKDIWKSKFYYTGTAVDEGYFLMGINKDKGEQITFHLKINPFWELTSFAEELEAAPEFDGHTKQDVIERLKKIK